MVPALILEKVLAIELGYRVLPVHRVSISLSPYYNFYRDLRSVDQPTPNNYIFGNHFKGEIYGAELAAQFQVTDWWRLRGGYNYIHKSLWPHGGLNVSASVREGNDPEHQFSFQSFVDLPAHFQFDVAGRWVDDLTTPAVPSYFSVDARLAWHFKNMEISLVGQNLCDSHHPEFGTQQIPRSVYGKVSWRF